MFISLIISEDQFPEVGYSYFILLGKGVKLIFTRDHISLAIAFKGPNVILGLYTCNYSLTVKQELGAATG